MWIQFRDNTITIIILSKLKRQIGHLSAKGINKLVLHPQRTTHRHRHPSIRWNRRTTTIKTKRNNWVCRSKVDFPMMSMRRVLYFRLAICRRLLSQRTSICFSPPEGAIRHVLAKVRLCSSPTYTTCKLVRGHKNLQFARAHGQETCCVVLVKTSVNNCVERLFSLAKMSWKCF